MREHGREFGAADEDLRRVVHPHDTTIREPATPEAAQRPTGHSAA